MTISEPVPGDVDTVWGLVGTLANLPRWTPSVTRCEMRNDDGRPVRLTHFPDWWIAERQLSRDPSGHRIDYVVSASSRPGIVGSRTRIEVLGPGPRNTLVRWRSRLPDPSPGPAAQLRAYYHARLAQLRAAVARPGPPETCHA